MRISDWSSDVCSSDLGTLCSGQSAHLPIMCRLFVGQWLGSIVCPHVPLQANHGGLTQRRSFLSLKSTARLARRARNPQYIALASPIHEAGHNEEMIGQTIKISKRLRIEKNVCSRADSGAFGPADNGAGQMDRGGCRISAGQNEAAQRD